jgi:hypothetical protein
VDAIFSFLKVATIGVFALIALVLVLLAIPQTRFKSTLTEILTLLVKSLLHRLESALNRGLA